MRSRIAILVFSIISAIGLAIAPGCQSPYRTAMAEYVTPRADRFVQRIDQAVGQQQDMRELLEQAADAYATRVETGSDTFDEEAEKERVLYERANWLAWDASKAVASVRDVARQYFAELDGERPGAQHVQKISADDRERIEARYNELIAVLEQADDSMRQSLKMVQRACAASAPSNGGQWHDRPSPEDVADAVNAFAADSERAAQKAEQFILRVVSISDNEIMAISKNSGTGVSPVHDSGTAETPARRGATVLDF